MAAVAVALPTKAKMVDHQLDLRMEVKAFEGADGVRVLEGLATTPSIDRMGDVVLPEGAVFQLPIPLLWQHDPGKPVGNVTAAIVTPEGIKVRCEFCPPGMLAAIDTHWQEIKAGLVRYLSIGFRELKSKTGKTGRIFESWEWLELSAVTIPANGEAAITTVRAYAVPQRDAQPRPIAARAVHRALESVGATAAPVGAARIGAIPMKLSEKIAAKKGGIVELKDRLAVLMDNDELDEQGAAEAEELSAQIDTETRALEILERAEVSLATRATAHAPAPVAQTQRSSQLITITPREPVKGDLLFKALTAQLYAHKEHRSLPEVLNAIYPGNTELDAFMKAAAAPANTTTTGWAAELVGQTIADFMESLVPLSVYAALASKGLRFSFGRAGKVIVPARGTVNNMAGDWIGEGAPIPVKQGSITSLTLTPKKLAVISTFTRELAMHSTPAIESMIRQMILEDTAVALDKFLVDTVAGSAVRPPGLLNGVTGTASSGTTLANIVTDLKAALNPILTANGGRNLVWLINPARLASLGLLTTAGGDFMFRDEVNSGRLIGFSFIVSNNVPADKVILVDAADFASATGDIPAFDVSDVATLHMEDTAPLPLATGAQGAGVVATPMRSLWQTASVGVRMIQDLSWGMRRTGMVSVITGVAW
jgi:HK97 family phage major capsid protein/HK97 family phage prohead protease